MSDTKTLYAAHAYRVFYTGTPARIDIVKQNPNRVHLEITNYQFGDATVGIDIRRPTDAIFRVPGGGGRLVFDEAEDKAVVGYGLYAIVTSDYFELYVYEIERV